MTIPSFLTNSFSQLTRLVIIKWEAPIVRRDRIKSVHAKVQLITINRCWIFHKCFYTHFIMDGPCSITIITMIRVIIASMTTTGSS